MNTSTAPRPVDYQLKSAFWISVIAGTLIMPFSFYHLFFQHILTGFGAMVVSLGLYLVAWHCHKKTYNSFYAFLLLGPFSTIYIAYVIDTIGLTGAYWSFPTVVLFYFLLSERQAWTSNILYMLITMPLAWQLFETHEVVRLMVTLVLTSLYAAIFLNVISRQYRALAHQAITDDLTGLYNRALLRGSLEEAIQQSHRTNTPSALIVLDIDHFKEINDELGHDVGDHVLRELGGYLKGFFRGSDKAFRLGGEEFLILLYNTDEIKGIQIAEKIRKHIEKLHLIPDQPVTVSIGVAGLTPDQDWQQWMKASDKNLYDAKHKGRNSVVACIG